MVSIYLIFVLIRTRCTCFIESEIKKKNSPCRGKTTPCGVALLVEDLFTQAEKIPKPWPLITNGPAMTAHSATAQLEGGEQEM
jgi:hypothetical protein